MVRILFGEMFHGRLDRATYLAYSGLLALFVLVFVFYVISTIIIDLTDLQVAMDKLTELGENPPIDIIVFGGVITLVQVNLVIKRLRDTGLIVMLSLTIVFMAYAMAPFMMFMGALEVTMLALMFIPTDTFASQELA